MNWGSFDEFVRMGGYAVYVWGSFGMCALVLVVELLGVAQRRRHLRDLPVDGGGEIGEGSAREA